MSVTPRSSSRRGTGSCPHSGMPGPPFGPLLRSTSTESGVASTSSIRAATSQMSSKTTAGPRCEKSDGEAALSLMTAPDGAS